MANRRLFLALWPDDRQRNLLRDTFRPLLTSIEGKAVDRRNWHVTLVFIGEFPDPSMPQLLIKLVEIEVQPFRLRFNKFMFWPRPKIACCDGLPPCPRWTSRAAGTRRCRDCARG